MKLYLKSRVGNVNAVAEYDTDKNTFTVLKGSVVSDVVARSTTFRGAASIEKYRSQYVKNSKVITDVLFKSASTAANFVTGRSTNGLVTWKNIEGQKLKDILK